MTNLFLECSARAALLVVATVLVLYALRVKPAAAKHAIWTGVLLLMLLLPAWTAWGPRASLRLLPPLPEKTVSHVIEPAADFPAVALPSNSATPEVPQPVARPRSVLTWQGVLLGVYLLGLCLLLLRLAIGTLRAQKLIRQSELRDGRRTSAFCAAPVTVGFFHPAVILPEQWTKWPQAQLDAVLTHEGEHARRRDSLVQWLALLNRALFWFHPAAWWLERHLSALAEEACDDVVLARGHNPREYSEYLLAIARSVVQSGARLNIPGMAMPGSGLPRRIRQIIEAGPAPRISRARMACVALACTITGVAFAAGTLGHARPSLPAQTAAKFVLGDLKIQGDVHDGDAVRDRVLKAWKDREYDDADKLADDVMRLGVREDFQQRGYFEVEAVDPVQQPLGLKGGKQRILVIAPVTEGEQFRLRTFSIQNYDQNHPLSVPAQTLRDQFPIREGDLFDVSALQSGIEKVKSMYRAIGYPIIFAVPNFTIEHEGSVIDITTKIIEEPPDDTGNGKGAIPPERLAALQKQFAAMKSKYASDHPDAPLLHQVVERIKFDGNRRISSEALASYIFTRPGDPYREDTLSRDFQALWNRRDFEDVHLEVRDSPSDPNGKIVVFHMVERPLISRIEYRGLQSVSQSEMLDRFKERRVGLSLETPFDRANVENAVMAIQELLAEHGHPSAVVKPHYDVIPGTNAVFLLIAVDEGPATSESAAKPAPAGKNEVGTPSCSYCPAPQYSEEARKAKFQGIVTVSAVVGTDGRATNIKVVGKPGFGLAEKAVAAVTIWRFLPAAGPDGKSVATVTSIHVHFNLPKEVSPAVPPAAAQAPSAQGPAAPPPAKLSFEAATIKPNRSGDGRFTMQFVNGRFTAVGMTLKALIEFAYEDIKDDQLAGAPSWASSERYDIDAKVEDSLAREMQNLPPDQRRQQNRLMVRSLLEDRFKLKVSNGTKELPVFALVVAKGGPKLSPTKLPPLPPPGSPGTSPQALPPLPPPGANPPALPRGQRGMLMAPGQLAANDAVISNLADALSRQPEIGGRVVLDRTGLTGSYDFTLKWTPVIPSPAGQGPDNAPPSDPSGPSLFTAIQEQLGLRLESQKAPVKTFVVDHVEQPSEN